MLGGPSESVPFHCDAAEWRQRAFHESNLIVKGFVMPSHINVPNEPRASATSLHDTLRVGSI